MMRRSIWVGAATLGVGVVGLVAHSQAAFPATASLNLSPSAGVAGTTVVVTGAGFVVSAPQDTTVRSRIAFAEPRFDAPAETTENSSPKTTPARPSESATLANCGLTVGGVSGIGSCTVDRAGILDGSFRAPSVDPETIQVRGCVAQICATAPFVVRAAPLASPGAPRSPAAASPTANSARNGGLGVVVWVVAALALTLVAVAVGQRRFRKRRRPRAERVQALVHMHVPPQVTVQDTQPRPAVVLRLDPHHPPARVHIEEKIRL